LGFRDFRKKHPETRGLTDLQIASIFEEKAKEIIFDNPLIYFRVHLRGMAHFLFSMGISSLFIVTGYYQHGEGIFDAFHNLSILSFIKFLLSKGQKILLIFTLNMLWIFLIYLPILSCIVLKEGRSRIIKTSDKVILLFVVFLYFWILSGGPAGGARLKSPVIPILALFSGCGFQYLIDRFGWKGKTKVFSSS